jgi:hypothetical protein
MHRIVRFCKYISFQVSAVDPENLYSLSFALLERFSAETSGTLELSTYSDNVATVANFVLFFNVAPELYVMPQLHRAERKAH